MKNTNNENIPKSFDKKERIEQNNFKNKTEKSAKNNDPENVQNEQNSINIEKLGVEYNFEIFKDNEDLFNSDKDSLSSPSNNKKIHYLLLQIINRIMKIMENQLKKVKQWKFQTLSLYMIIMILFLIQILKEKIIMIFMKLIVLIE